MPRKALKTISANVAREPQQPKPNAKSLQKVAQENEELKAQIATLTAQLEQAKLDTSTVEKKDEPRINPFGGFCPPAVTKPFIPTYIVPTLHHPKRPETAFQSFCKDNRAEVTGEMSDATVQQVNAKLAEMWKSCDETTQASYQEKVKDDHVRYEKEMEVFNERKKQAEFEQKAVENLKNEIRQEEAIKLYDAYIESEGTKKKDTADSSTPDLPKNARNAYHFFLSENHKKGQTTVSEVAEQWKKLQTSRKKVDKATVQKFNKMAEEDQHRHAEEMATYQQTLSEIAAASAEEQEAFKKRAIEVYSQKLQSEQNAVAFKKIQAEKEQVAKLERKKEREEKKAAKAAKADEPKRPKNAYTIYFAENATAVAERLRKSGEGGTAAGVLGAQWRALSAAQKKKYETAAEKDRVRYRKEMEEYNAKKQAEAESDAEA